ncbi:hypothetical protein [Hymenobacter metallicola]|nr:hypothetical protein [Hymenobacter metallicola]
MTTEPTTAPASTPELTPTPVFISFTAEQQPAVPTYFIHETPAPPLYTS